MIARRYLLALALGVCSTALFAVSADPLNQVRRKLPEPAVDRAWETDAEGLRQWTAFDERCALCRGGKTTECEHCKGYEDLPACAECDLTKKADCRACRGSGRAHDPLEALVCPYCWGSTWYGCKLCKTRGRYPVKGGGSGNRSAVPARLGAPSSARPARGSGSSRRRRSARVDRGTRS